MKISYSISALLLLLSGFSFAQERVTLVESWTSATCVPCNTGNVDLEAILNDPQNLDKTASVKYQTDWPTPGDPYFTDEVETRRAFYNVTVVPETRLDGGSGFDPSALTQEMLDGALAQPPSCLINAWYNLTAPNTINIGVEVTALEDFPGGTVLQCAVVERTTANNVMTNGETEFYNVMKKMVPAANGTFLIAVDSADVDTVEVSHAFQGSYFLPADASDPIDHLTEHSVEDFNDLGVVVWVQRITTKEVLNAGNAVIGVTGLDENELFGTAKIYPNPANNSAAIAYQIGASSDVKISIVNTMGQVVYEDFEKNIPQGRTVKEVNTSDFSNGLYIVNIQTELGTLSRKLSIDK